MFEIKSPKKFLKQLIIVEFILGLGLIIIGSLLLINLYVYLYINHGFYAYTIASTIFRIILIITGLCKIISFLFLKKSNNQGLNLSMISFILLTINFLYLSTLIFIFEIIHIFTGGELIIYSIQFALSCFVSLVSIYMFLIIFRNRENFKKRI